MAKKLIFNKSGGNNISIDEENLTANEWTSTTVADFGKYAPVFFNGKLYFNKTGTFTEMNPFSDTTNWEEIGSGGGSNSGNITTITYDDTTGVVTVTYNDSTPTETFQAGHRIQEVGGTPFRHRDLINFIGNIDILDNNGNARTDLYLEHLTNSSIGDSQENTTGFLVSGGLGGKDNKQPLATFRQLQGTTGEITITPPDPSDPGAVANPNVLSAPELRTGLDSLIGSPNGTIGNITDVTITDLKNNDILEYDAVDTTWKNKDVPTGSAQTLEQLTDVDITDRVDGKTIVSAGSVAYVDIEADNNATNIFGLETTNGLLFVAPSGDTAIDTVHIGIARNRTDTTDYIISDNELLVELEFASGNPTRDQMYARVAGAFNDTNFPDGQRTINSKVYHKNGDWTTPTNPRHIPAATASGSQAFSLRVSAGNTDSGRFDFTITSSTGHFTHMFGLTNFSYTPDDAPSRAIALQNLLNQITAELNAFTPFSNLYTASNDGVTLTITADVEGAASNGTFGFIVRDTSGNPTPNMSANTFPGSITVHLTGGTDVVDSLTTLRWTNTDNEHTITKPTPFSGTTLYFKQGGFAWTDTDFALRNLTDVGENTNTFPQMLIRPDSSDFNHIDARIQNLDVINRAEKFKQGTLLQYADGYPLWEYCGLGDDGTVDSNNRPNFFKTPEENQFLVYNFRGGLDPQWTARFPLMDDVATLTNPKLHDILLYDGTNWVNSPIPIAGGEIGCITSTSGTNASGNVGVGSYLLNDALLSEFNYGTGISGVNGYLTLKPGVYRFGGSFKIQLDSAGTSNQTFIVNIGVSGRSGSDIDRLNDIFGNVINTPTLTYLAAIDSSNFYEGSLPNLGAYVEFVSDINNVKEIEYDIKGTQVVDLRANGGVLAVKWIANGTINGINPESVVYQDPTTGSPNTNLSIERIK